ncbi:site-specific integrase [Kocuria soli]|uniref:Site-specific integrase n=1 Tax=Kocuria soli TaxID=2485125 RepID=A0A3N3ZV03_9MICC|nr:site-specific integrase [Kocuria soli]ROZ63827.1 site-specific integrase [Kocuria soli]
MATVESYETKTGRRYRVRYRTPDRRQTDKRGFTTKRDAERFARTIEVSKDRGEWIDPADTRVTVGELGEWWIASRSSLKPSTLRTVESAWRVHVEPRWGPVPVSDVRFSAVEAWVAELAREKSPTTVKRAHGVLSSILASAVRDRRILANPAEGVSLPRKVAKAHVYLSHVQLHALAAASDRPALVLVLGYTGLRWGEAIGLRVKDVDTARRRIRVERNAVQITGARFEVGTPKSHKQRSVPYPAFLASLVAEQLEGKAEDDLLFPGRTGGFQPRPNLFTGDGGTRSWFTAALERAGLPKMTVHDLRHTAASLAVASGANVKAVQRMLGHASAAMTLDVYADLFDDDLEAVATSLDHAFSQTNVGRTWAECASGE